MALTPCTKGHAMGPPKQGWLAAAARHRRRLPLVAGLITAAALLGMLLWLAPGGVPGGSLHIRALVQGRANDSGYRSAAAAALLPALVRREEQLALERRWGVQPILEPQQGWGPPGIKLPRILHHVYFPNISAFMSAAANPASSDREELPQSCRALHPGWQYIFWDWEAATKLVGTYYPEYFEMFQQLDSIIKRADAIRYFIMHAIGGLYLDLDIECFQPVDRWLADYDVVLQDPGPTNGVVASVPGHPLWLKALALMKERWQENPGREVVELTGPGLMSSTFKFNLGPDGPKERPEQPDPWSGEHVIEGSRVMVYPLQRYFHPCEWDDHSCHKELAMQRALGTVNLTRFAGYHRFAASWQGGGGAGVLTADTLKQQLCSGS
ncbi:hypothetical protein COHA_007403 [Chlorella ohadii]|uniref:Uncharacterized protein n=1 Tax=Chlorella ohadii TaxID=2649997 RepID=A0AAD5H2M2_9CHLO|nr:hypothetical protein COHA_007403 [Chlorella ohadii]